MKRCDGRRIDETITDPQADQQQLAVSLVTASAHAFYERHGYTVVGETFIGKEDPTWDGPPAGICVVSEAQLCGFG